MSISMMFTKKIGKEKKTFVVSGNNLWECQMQAQKLSFNDVSKCGLCGSDNLYLFAYEAQGQYQYVKVICKACGASVQFSSPKKDGNTFYLKKNDQGKLKWEPHPDKKFKKSAPSKTPDPPEPEEKDDLPF